MLEEKKDVSQAGTKFSGNIFIFYAFDMGDDFDLDKVEKDQPLIRRPYSPPKYFRNYHIPLSVELPHPHDTSSCLSVKLLRFGVLSLIYKIPFNDSLEDLQKSIIEIDEKYQEQSVSDANSVFKKLKPYIIKPDFFHLRSGYTLIQANPLSGQDSKSFKEKHGSDVASLLRFETKNLSVEQRGEVLESATSYFRGDLLIIDNEAAFVSDPEYDEILEIFEFANIQQLELQYFDRMLGDKLNQIYEARLPKVPWTTYLPFVNTYYSSTMELGKLRVDISVTTDQLENSIKLTGDPYLTDIYEMLGEKLELHKWRNSIVKKLDIIQDVRSIYENQVASIREDMMNVLIIILIFIELVIALLHYISD